MSKTTSNFLNYLLDFPPIKVPGMKFINYRTEAYQATGKFWDKISSILGESHKPEEDDIDKCLSQYKSRLKEIFEKFEKNSNYSTKNSMWSLGESIIKLGHKLTLGVLNKDALKEIQTELELLWEKFFNLRKNDGIEAFIQVFEDFAERVKIAAGVSESAPSSEDSTRLKGPQRNVMFNGRPIPTNPFTMLSGEADQLLVMIKMKKEAVNAYYLPDFLELQPLKVDGIADDETIVILACGTQNAKLTFVDTIYQEVYVIIPKACIRNKSNNKSQTFQIIPEIFVNDPSVALFARGLWKMNKVFAMFEKEGDFPRSISGKHQEGKNRFSCEAYNQSTVLSYSFRILSDFRKGKDFKNFSLLKEILDDPAIYWDRNENMFTTDYKPNFDKLLIQEVEATIEFSQIAGVGQTPVEFNVPSLASNVVGACKVRFPWKLGPATPVIYM